MKLTSLPLTRSQKHSNDVTVNGCSLSKQQITKLQLRCEHADYIIPSSHSEMNQNSSKRFMDL